MNLDMFARIFGTATILLLFILKFWIAINPRSTMKTLRTAILWTSIYIFFLFIVRLLSLLNIGSLGELRILSGFTSIIPLMAVVIQLSAEKAIKKQLGDTEIIINPVNKVTSEGEVK